MSSLAEFGVFLKSAIVLIGVVILVLAVAGGYWLYEVIRFSMRFKK